MFNKRRFFINLGLGLIFAVSIAFYYLTIVILTDQQKTGDFNKFYMSAKFYWEGKSIYSPVTQSITKTPRDKGSDSLGNNQLKGLLSSGDTEHANLNPPFQTLLLVPLGLIKFEHGFLIYSFISIISGLVAVLLIAHETATKKYELSYLFTFMIILMAYFPTWSNILYGQLSLILLLLITLVWITARNGRDALAGIY